MGDILLYTLAALVTISILVVMYGGSVRWVVGAAAVAVLTALSAISFSNYTDISYSARPDCVVRCGDTVYAVDYAGHILRVDPVMVTLCGGESNLVINYIQYDGFQYIGFYHMKYIRTVACLK